MSFGARYLNDVWQRWGPLKDAKFQWIGEVEFSQHVVSGVEYQDNNIATLA
jgi:hypothetical protein